MTNLDGFKYYVHQILENKTNKPFPKIFNFSGKSMDMTTNEYIDRIVKFVKLEIHDFVGIAIYLDKITKLNYDINEQNICYILATLCLLFIKYNDDINFMNDVYAQMFGISAYALNIFELYCLFLLNYELYISKETYDEFYEKLK